MRRLIASAAGAALAGALLLCQGAGAAEAGISEAQGHRHTHAAPRHHHPAPAHQHSGDHSSNADLGDDCQAVALVDGAPVSVEAPSFTVSIHTAIPAQRSSGAGFPVAHLHPSPPVSPPTLVQQHVLIRI
jgi:hypothetical protein